MKRLATVFCSVIAVVVFCVSVAQAQAGRPHIKRIARVDTRWERKADRNRNGFVDPHEADKAKKDYIKHKSQVNTPWEFRADRNHDGHVGPHEAARATHHLPN